MKVKHGLFIYSSVSPSAMIACLVELGSEILDFEACICSSYSDLHDWSGSSVNELQNIVGSYNDAEIQIEFGSGQTVVVSPGDESTQTLGLTCLELSGQSTRDLVSLIRVISSTLRVEYAYLDRLCNIRVAEWELDSRNSQPAPYWCLRDLYLYNYFGKTLSETLRNFAGLLPSVEGLSIKTNEDSLEIIVDSRERSSGHPASVSNWMAEIGCFQSQDRRAKFSTRLRFGVKGKG